MANTKQSVTVKRENFSNGLPGQLSAFFRENPQEELSLADIMAKFDVRYVTVLNAVKRMKAGGVLESVHVVRRASPD